MSLPRTISDSLWERIKPSVSDPFDELEGALIEIIAQRSDEYWKYEGRYETKAAFNIYGDMHVKFHDPNLDQDEPGQELILSVPGGVRRFMGVARKIVSNLQLDLDDSCDFIAMAEKVIHNIKEPGTLATVNEANTFAARYGSTFDQRHVHARGLSNEEAVAAARGAALGPSM